MKIIRLKPIIEKQTYFDCLLFEFNSFLNYFLSSEYYHHGYQISKASDEQVESVWGVPQKT